MSLRRVESGAKTRDPVLEPTNKVPVTQFGPLYLDDEPAVWVGPIGCNVDGLALELLDLLPGAGSGRLSGIAYPSLTFGFTPPQPLRQRYAPSSSVLAREHPDVHARLETLAEASWTQFWQSLPDRARTHLDAIDDIHPDWLIGDTGWTSGIINYTAALPYHRDSGNVSGTWSAMAVLRNRCSGGWLHLPDLDTYLACEDRTVNVFDGAHELHGVTPLTLRPRGYRISIVFYTKAAFRGVGDYHEALSAGKRRASQKAAH